jgi:hypothetical protein
VCGGGIVLCADTQETIPGYTKTDANKLIGVDMPGMNLLFAGAGNNAVQIDETVQAISRALSKASPRKDEELMITLRGCLGELFPRQYYPRPNSAVEVDLLMASRAAFGLRLFHIADCSIARVYEKACIGTGVILGAQLLQRHYDYAVQLTEAAIICAYVFHHVKRWVDGCGGNTDIALVPDSAAEIIFLPSAEVNKFEKYSEAYDEAVRGLLLAVPRTPKNISLFNQYVEAAKNQLQAARTQFQEWEDLMREVAVLTGQDYEQMRLEAEASASAMLAAKSP